MFSALLAVVLVTPLTAGCLWLAMKLLRVEGSVLALLVIAAVTNTVMAVTLSISVQFIGLGALVATAVGLVLLVKLTDADLWPDAVIMWIVAAFALTAASGLLFNGLFQS